MKIIILGAGIAGLAAARALCQRGSDVIVLEQADAIREVGAGLQISPNGFRVIEALGLGAELRNVALRAEAVCLNDYSGQSITRLDLGRLRSQDYYFVHRSDLIQVLADGARAAGADIRLQQQAERLELGEDPMVTLADGSSLTCDLVIGADGLHSVARHAINGSLAPFFTGQVAWRTIVPNRADRGPEVQVHMGPHRHIVSYPLRDGSALNLVAVQERAAWQAESWIQEDDPANLRAAFADFGPDVQEMLADVDQVHLWGLFRHAVSPAWYGDGAVLIGDAAHPMLPFLAQGASMALEDVWVLSEALSLSGRMETRLAAYQTRRDLRVRRVVTAAGGNAWKYHLASPPLRWVAHTVIRIGGRIFPDRMVGQFNWLYDHDVTK